MTISEKRLQAIAYGSVRQSQEEGVEMARMLLERSAEYPETLPCSVIQLKELSHSPAALSMPDIARR